MNNKRWLETVDPKGIAGHEFGDVWLCPLNAAAALVAAGRAEYAMKPELPDDVDLAETDLRTVEDAINDALDDNRKPALVDGLIAAGLDPEDFDNNRERRAGLRHKLKALGVGRDEEE